jgi:EAL domain-containing protein (putative c-di-GMP-specific phosphodiesterase class I)
VAEETGLIVSLGEQILDQVCAQIREWDRRGLRMTVSVNVTSRQFTDPRFIAEFGRITREHGIDMRSIELEVIERALLADTQEAARRMEALRALGVRVAIDDFGTGYSSLAYLKNLPIDTVKVDGRFTQEITRHPRDQAILRAIVSLCHDLGLELVAEGIETEEQRTLLDGMGCRLGQGYLYSRPLPANLLEARLAHAGGVDRRAGRA